MDESRPTLHLPAREIPIPMSVSAEAQAVLSMPPMAEPPYPDLEDVHGGRDLAAGHDRRVPGLVSARAEAADVTPRDRDFGAFCVYDITPAELVTRPEVVYLDIHGGTFIHGAGATCRAMGIG